MRDERHIKYLQSKIGENFYSQFELDKMWEALKEKYPELHCDGLPYYPQPTKILLSGKEIIKK